MDRAMDTGAEPRPPNFIVIFCDDLGYGDLGCYGSADHDTPRLDRMAAEGMRFTDAYVPSPVCTPSRAGLLTGCYPRRVGLEAGEGNLPVLFPGDAIGLSGDEVTIASLLRAQGYATGMVGKWHLGDQRAFLPPAHGFDDFLGLPYSNDMHCDLELPPEIGRMPPLMLLRQDRVVEADPNQVSLTDRYLVHALRFIHDNRDRPFFLYFAHHYVHLPIHVPQNYLRTSRNGPYSAAVAHVDFTVGAILDTLADLGIDEHTLVIFTSDNGASVAPASRERDRQRRRTGGTGSNGPLRGGKGTTWEGGMREPFIAWRPGTVPAGAACRELCTTMDLLPTFARMAGTTEPTDRTIDGRDLTPLLTGRPGAGTPHEVFCYYSASTRCLDAVRRGRWKLHLGRHTGGLVPAALEASELYDLEADVGETTDLSGREPAVVRELLDLADACRDDLGDARTGIAGADRRPVGRVDDPVTLLPRPEEHLWVRAYYD
ncbi:MAG: sulfatase [Spirochaetaceae bacterium]|nr:sulfatase [Spirochaetaceae bacterium]